MSSSAYIPHTRELQLQFRAEGLWNDERLPDYIEKWARETPDNVAMLVPGGPSLTYRDTLAKSRRFANALLALGLRKGDVIAIQLPSHPEFLIAYFGVVMMGGVLCTLHMPYRAGEMRPLMQFAEAKAVICTPPGDKYDATAVMLGLVGKVPTLKHGVVAYGELRSIAAPCSR